MVVFFSAEFSPDEKSVLITNDYRTYIWNLYSHTVDTLCGDKDICYSTFSIDGNLVFTTNDQSIKVWNVQKKKCIDSIRIRKNDSTPFDDFILVSPNGRHFLVSSSSYKIDMKYSMMYYTSFDTLYLWDLQTKNYRAFCYDKPIWHFQFSKDGKYIYIPDEEENRIRVLFSDTGEEVTSLSASNNWSFSPNDFYYIYEEDGKWFSKQLPPLQDLIDETRERFKDRPLTPEERHQYYLE